LWTICPGWPRTLILPISASQVARITDYRYEAPASALVQSSSLCVVTVWTYLDT
jgi:hypothetical protein